MAHLTGEILIMENYNPMRIKIIYITHRYMHVTKKYHLILLQYSKKKKSINIKYEYAVFGNSSLHKCYLYRLRKNTIYDRINQHLRRFFFSLVTLSFVLFTKLYEIIWYFTTKTKENKQKNFSNTMGMVTTL